MSEGWIAAAGRQCFAGLHARNKGLQQSAGVHVCCKWATSLHALRASRVHTGHVDDATFAHGPFLEHIFSARPRYCAYRHARELLQSSECRGGRPPIATAPESVAITVDVHGVHGKWNCSSSCTLQQNIMRQWQRSRCEVVGQRPSVAHMRHSYHRAALLCSVMFAAITTQSQEICESR